MTNQAINENKEKTKGNPLLNLLKAAASVKLTVVCLLFLTILVVWGTLYQADHGLYQAQQKFFHSWFFLVFGFIPFPGTVLVMFVLFFNLVNSLLFRIGFRLSNIGNIVTHLGIIVLLVGGFFTFYFSEESSLMLMEGETSHLSTSRKMWEVAVWERKGGDKDVYAVDAAGMDTGDVTRLEDLGITISVKEFYENCTPFKGSAPDGTRAANASGIGELKEKSVAMEMSENVAGGVFDITGAAGSPQPLLLYGQESIPTPITIGSRTFVFSLRKQKIPLPLSMTLLDFKVSYYPNSQIPKSYRSRVTIKSEGSAEREVVISMNKPLRFADLTFFQSGYHIAPNGTEYTILAVVKNFGRLLPYFSSLIIFLGLTIHFVMMLLRRRKQQLTQKG